MKKKFTYWTKPQLLQKFLYCLHITRSGNSTRFSHQWLHRHNDVHIIFMWHRGTRRVPPTEYSLTSCDVDSLTMCRIWPAHPTLDTSLPFPSAKPTLMRTTGEVCAYLACHEWTKPSAHVTSFSSLCVGVGPDYQNLPRVCRWRLAGPHATYCCSRGMVLVPIRTTCDDVPPTDSHYGYAFSPHVTSSPS